MNKFSSFRIALFILVVSTFAGTLFAWHHDGIPMSEYTKKGDAADLFFSDAVKDSLNVIFSAYQKEGIKVDPKYSELFGQDPNRHFQVFGFVTYFTCINFLVHSIPHLQLTLAQTDAKRSECKMHLSDPLPYDLFRTVKESDASNPYKSSVVFFLNHLKLHQNVLDISTLIRY